MHNPCGGRCKGLPVRFDVWKVLGAEFADGGRADELRFAAERCPLRIRFSGGFGHLKH